VNFQKKAKDIKFDKKAKNIIIFIGDGMGLTTITAGRIFKGQYLNKNRGEEEMLAFDEFPHTGLAKVCFRVSSFNIQVLAFFNSFGFFLCRLIMLTSKYQIQPEQRPRFFQEVKQLMQQLV